MRNYSTTIIGILFLMSAQFTFGQLNFYNQYANEGADYGEGIVQLEDSSYAICGSSSSFTNGHSQAFLLKLDSLGNRVWSNHYGGFESESARRVMYKKNFGFFIAGFTNSIGAGAYDFYLAKISEVGTLEWQKSYGGEGWDRVRDAKMTLDTGVVMVGEITNTNGDQDWYVVKTDMAGDTLWTRTFGRGGNDIANCVELYQDSLYVIGGTVFNEDSLKTKSMFVYLDADGTIIDSLELGSNGSYALNDITIWNDTIQGVGNYKFSDTNQYDISFYRMKIYPDSLALIALTIFNPPGDYYGHLITAYGDGSKRYVAMGTENQPLAFVPGQDLFVGHYTSTFVGLGNVCWLTEPFPDYGGQFIATSDGGAAMTGYRSGVGESQGTVFLLKIGKNDTYPVINGLAFIYDLVSVEETNEIVGLNLFPNPTTNNLTVEVSEPGDYTVSIVNVLGQEVYLNNIVGTETIDVSTFAAGSYVVNISNAELQVSSCKISIQ